MAHTSEVMHQLVRATQGKFKANSYGRIRSKLEKQGFSEIALFEAVAHHIEANDIDPLLMVDDMMELLEGCSRNLAFLNTNNIFPFLRSKFHSLRHGDLTKGEPKSSEQRGNFLCNLCHIVKEKNTRAKKKTAKNSCHECVQAAAKAYRLANPAPSVKKVKPTIRETVELVEEPTIEETPTNTVTKEEIAMLTLEPLTPVVPTVKPEGVKIVEVMSDSETASVTINCPPRELYLVLNALSPIVS